MTATKNAPEAWQGIEDEATETRSKETVMTIVSTPTDTRPAASNSCEVTGCQGDAGTHDPRDASADWTHDLAPLQGHSFDVSATRAGAAPWAGWVQVDTNERLLTAHELRQLSAALAAEATRIDVLNAAGPTVTGPHGQLIHPESLLMEALASADISGRAVTRLPLHHHCGVVMSFRLRPPFRVVDIVIEATTVNSPAVPAVSIEVEGERVTVTPDNARQLATALLAHAAAAERPSGASEWP